MNPQKVGGPWATRGNQVQITVIKIKMAVVKVLIFTLRQGRHSNNIGVNTHALAD